MPAWADFLLNGVCHRFPEHALVYGGHPSLLCARCTGLFCGAVLVLVLFAGSGARRRGGYAPWFAQGLFAALGLWWAFDGANAFAFEWLGRPLLYEPTAAIRLLSGLGLGMAIGTELWSVGAQTLLDAPDARAAIERPGAGSGDARSRRSGGRPATWRAPSLVGGSSVEPARRGRVAGRREQPAAGHATGCHGRAIAGLASGTLSCSRELPWPSRRREALLHCGWLSAPSHGGPERESAPERLNTIRP